MDDIDQLLFVYEHAEIAGSQPPVGTYLPLWQHFRYLVDRFNWITRNKWNPNRGYLPHRWLRANAAVVLFNRIVEDRVDVGQMRARGGLWTVLADAYDAYRNSLEAHGRCDFAHLQRKLLDFLSTPNGQLFLNGDGSDEHPGISYVLVDEYQDTNPIQERIYLGLAERTPHNLCVVGDDDQALYRFRGGTVACMVNFDCSCRQAWGSQVIVTQRPLSTNYRSSPGIVSWYDEYIRSFATMTQPGARVANKPQLVADPNWQLNKQTNGATIGNYPDVSFVVGQTEADVADLFADLVQGLLTNGIVTDRSQCVLLVRSTRDRSAGLYQNALQRRDIPVYNPRARTFLDQEEVQSALGTLMAILDPGAGVGRQVAAAGIQAMIQTWAAAYNQLSQIYPPLRDYVDRSVARIRQIPANQTVTQLAQQVTTFPATIQEILYHIISFEPFLTWQGDPERTLRLGQLTKLLEAYCTLPFPQHPGSSRGTLRTEPNRAGTIYQGQLNHLYYALVGLLTAQGLNDPEDEEVICPPGRFPVMTVHQAKGLEFPFVFVTKLGVHQAPVGAEILLEDELSVFTPTGPVGAFNAQARAEQDYVRLFYVAYSRAEYALVLLATAPELRDQGLGFGGFGRRWFEQRATRIA